MEQQENTNEKDIEVRGNGTQVFTEPYSRAAIARLKNLILAFFNQSEYKYYSISVDGETVVQRTCDSRKFDDYERFLCEYTRHVEVKMFQGTSPNCNKYVFTIPNKSASGLGMVGATDMQSQIDRAVEEQRVKMELENTRTKLIEAQEAILKKDKKIKKLKEEIPSGADTAEKWVNTIGGVFSNIAAAKNSGLAGTPVQPQAEASIEPDGEEEEETDETESLKIYKRLHEKFGEETIIKAFTWLAVLAANPDIGEKIKEALDQKKTENGKA
ncbi:MAG: hypothetical protein HYZ14_03065 [Bacteroidetes bacterium]|nr:hypothetical protein [Bacteroidota bacterium]